MWIGSLRENLGCDTWYHSSAPICVVRLEVMARLREIQARASKQGCQTHSQGLETREPSLQETQGSDFPLLEQIEQEKSVIREKNEETSTKVKYGP